MWHRSQLTLAQLNSENPTISSLALKAFGDFTEACLSRTMHRLFPCQIAPKLVAPALPELMAFILRWLVDAAYLSHRLLILDVLGRLARSTGYVVAPYSEFPTLMPILFDIIKNDKSPEICHEVCCGVVM